MKLVNLREVILNIGDGGTPSTKIKEYFGGDIPWVNIEDIKKDIYDTKRHLSESGLKNSSAKLWPEGTLIFSFGASIGKVGIARVKLCTKQGIAGIIPDPKKIYNEFLYYILLRQGDRIRMIGQSMGSTIKEVRPSKLVRLISFPLPPLPEQQKIAEILSTVDSAIEKVDSAIEKTKRLKKGLMHELLTEGIGHKEFKNTEIGRIPKEWEVVKLEKVSLGFIGGGTPSTSKPNYWNGDIAWMTSAHLNGREVTTGQRYITREGLKNSATKLVPKDNLLVATRVGIGKAAVNKIEIAISQDLTGVIIDKNKALPEFLYWIIINSEKKLKSLAQGSTIKGILREELAKLKIPLPPLHEQKKIAEILSSIDKKLEILRKRKEKLERIKKGLMEDLLTGKKRVKV
ncbi:restriction endonuclease subunit S [Candidatus Aminicenantes bacterium AC-708-M15]|jgi:type I restriction enzyme S subunit|nr:restriction endonuclease subunit S [SCandidatus Aminicenantes bacterium Aminicenantia_JdfR_composite]MCP2596509.1 restriction endonuclease subunit S [Candidatus Aminicenantes bacterium AC-335-G13]MCP2598674.1 restriction endonuclease subunit S [Candidatus Aminicenantes bacterium AC-335-L06]MCP2603906.1 restriction endonuclease subunit S [Candidatus Aminicenantes bacterium AC-708-M15]MCP2605719.1 restriction endonuclease subunit S [Candidatus Aminicenantes bacterium AC-335-O07]MCP2618103.1 r